MPRVLAGPVHTHTLFSKKRRYSVLTMPFHEVLSYFEPVPYDATTGRGEQREECPAQVRALKKAFESGEYTPTCWSASVPLEMQGAVHYEDGGSSYRLEIPQDREGKGLSLPLTNGGQRRAALLRLMEEWEEELREAETEPERARIEAVLQDLADLPVTLFLYLDGAPQLDFLRQQLGRKVEPTLILALSLETETIDDPVYSLAQEVAALLQKTPGSPYFAAVQLDARSKGIPLATLMAKGPSDLAVSLLGLARVGLKFDMDARVLTNLFTTIRLALKERCDDILNLGYPLTLPERGGTRGAATMYIALAVCLAYRMGVRGLKTPSAELLGALAEAAEKALGTPLSGNFSAASKRNLVGNFAERFFADEDGPIHECVPLALCELLSPTAFGLSPLKRKRAHGGALVASAVVNP